MERIALVYDDDCGLCRWILGVILRWDRDRKLRAVALSSPQAKELLAALSEDERMASWHLVRPDGEVFSAGNAITPLMRALPFGAPLAVVAETFPRATSRAYDLGRPKPPSSGKASGSSGVPDPRAGVG